MTATHWIVQGGVVLAILVLVGLLAAAGRSRSLRSRILDAIVRILARPDPFTLLRETAAILLSDEWRDRLRQLERRHGRRPIRRAVVQLVREGVPEGDFPLPTGRGERGIAHIAGADPARTVARRGREWLRQNARRARA